MGTDFPSPYFCISLPHCHSEPAEESVPLSALDYGNEDKVQYEYDKKGRVTKETFEDGDTATYTYDNNGVLSKVTDSATGITSTYYYDSTERLMKYVESGTGHDYAVGYQYDTLNNLTKLVETINGVEHTTNYTYDEDNRITDITNGAASTHHEYDDFGRMAQTVTKHNGSEVLTKSATFKSPAAGKTGLQVETYTIDANGFNVTYTYTYDAKGNILSISDGTNTTSYVYDSANQLIRENNQAGNFTQKWSYDDAGNITARIKYAYTTDSLDEVEIIDSVYYTYGDSQWGDLLTGYNGQTITSDAIGNMTGYDIWAYTWEHGRNLVSARGLTPLGLAVDYTYDTNGMRTSKVAEGVVTTYVYEGDRLVQLNQNGNVCYFTYDANGNPATMSFNEDIYYYVVNPQGDVVSILDPNGQMVVNYVYDAWGNTIQCDCYWPDPIDRYNPFRYRGYVYDELLNLYYLQSRYYSPRLGRFISADDVEVLLEDDETPLQYNLFSYCWNNPVNSFDPDGHWTLALAGGGYLATAGTIGVSNAWNPAGWIVLGTVAVATVVAVGIDIYNSVSVLSSNEADPYACPGQKKQGRERKNKARKRKDWKPRSNPKPPKKHTPGRGHRKYK